MAQKLPNEIVLQIIDSLVDFGPLVPVALPGHDSRTRTLCSFLTVSWAFHSTAKRQLYKNCLYINSARKLRLLLRTLTESPSTDLLPFINSLFLEVCGADGTIDDLPIAKWILELFSLISPTLTRLVVNIPLRSLYPEDDHLSVRPTLREAFSRLVNLEEFTSILDELYLSTRVDTSSFDELYEDIVWKDWPQLKKLALYNPDVHLPFAKAIKTLPHLETLVLTRADGLTERPIPHILRKDCESQNLRILVVNDTDSLRIEVGEGDQWRAYDDDGTVQFHQVPSVKDYKGQVEVVKMGIELGQDADPIETCQRAVQDAAIRGSLWKCSRDWAGNRIAVAPVSWHIKGSWPHGSAWQSH